MGEGEPGEGRSFRSVNPMTLLVFFLMREVMVPPFFIIPVIGLLRFLG